jgi:hypothetical protein
MIIRTQKDLHVVTNSSFGADRSLSGHYPKKAYVRLGGHPPRMLQTCSTGWGPPSSTAPFLRFS